jgi:hypothetical protein
MKLLDIWNSRESWMALADMKKPPKVAYRLMRYHAKINAELVALEAGREAAVYEAAGVEGPAIVSLNPGSVEYEIFIKGFNKFLDEESDLSPVGISMDALVDALDGDAANRLTERQLALLEPFFTEKAPVLELVKA